MHSLIQPINHAQSNTDMAPDLIGAEHKAWSTFKP